MVWRVQVPQHQKHSVKKPGEEIPARLNAVRPRDNTTTYSSGTPRMHLQLPMYGKAVFERMGPKGLSARTKSCELIESSAWTRAIAPRSYFPSGAAASPLSHSMMTGFVSGLGVFAVCWWCLRCCVHSSTDSRQHLHSLRLYLTARAMFEFTGTSHLCKVSCSMHEFQHRN